MLAVVRMLAQQRPAFLHQQRRLQVRQAQAAITDTDRAAHEADVQQPRDDLDRKGPVPVGGRDQRRDLV